MRQIKIAWAAQMRAGKDTAADFLTKEYGAKNMKFADPLYDILAYAQNRLHLPQKKDRHFLQFCGTEWVRDTIAKDHLILTLLNDVAKESGNVVVSDARFQNEFEALQEAGFLVVKIERDEALRMRYETNPNAEQKVHASELDVLTYDKFDAVVQNNGTIEEFEYRIASLIAKRFNTQK